LWKSCRLNFKFYCMFYFTCDRSFKELVTASVQAQRSTSHLSQRTDVIASDQRLIVDGTGINALNLTHFVWSTPSKLFDAGSQKIQINVIIFSLIKSQTDMHLNKTARFRAQACLYLPAIIIILLSNKNYYSGLISRHC